MNAIWEKAKSNQAPIVAFRCYVSSLPVQETRHKPAKAQSNANSELFEGLTTEGSADETVITNKRVEYIVRLPYTRESLLTRRANGRDLPDFIDLGV